MNKHYLHIGFIWRGPVKQDEIRPIFDLAEDWIMYGGNNWIIYTDQAPLQWCGWLRAVLGPDDSVLIVELNGTLLAGGVMPQWVWDWVNRDRNEPATFGLKTFSPPPIG